VAADGKIYLIDYQGTVTVVKAGPKFEVLAKNVIPDTFTASPAIADCRIYFRGYRALYAIQDVK
jgi:outer membrane protein assembly factor BamB